MMSASDLDRFRDAQKRDFQTALSEIRSGRKRSHWMWYIFPQIRGLGMTYTADYYGIVDLEEAKAYLSDPYLSGNLLEISKALLELKESNPSRIFGYPDDLKLRSCMTLFYLAAEGEEKAVFKAVLDKYYSGQQDDLTIKRLGRNR